MAAITTGVVLGGAALYGADRQASAAEDAAKRQASGVSLAQDEAIAATDRARLALTGMANPVTRLTNNDIGSPNPRQAEILSEIDSLRSQMTAPTRGRGPGFINDPNNSAISSRILDLTNELQSISPEITAEQVNSQPVSFGDPAANVLTGLDLGARFTNQGFSQAENAINPLAQLAAPYLDEQHQLLGLGGNEAYQEAISRIADPLAEEEERAILRNNAQFGGVGGNVLSQLADRTRARTEANIGNRLSQLASASSPALAALQQISGMRLNRGLSLADLFGGTGRDLATREENRRLALANIEVGHGNQLSQLAQNLGTATAGGAAYRAQNAPAITQGLSAGLGGFLGAGGQFPVSDPYFNRSSGYGNIGDPFSP